MKTRNEKVKAVVSAVREAAPAAFGERCVAVYVMGSLARGGFSEAASDIDIGIMLRDPLEPTDAAAIDAIANRAREREPELPNRISIFWGSVESLNNETKGGRYPPFDRLDLIDHALLLYGEDTRDQLVRPQQRELMVAGAAFALGYLATEERIAEFRCVERIADRGIVHLTKTILFPARFIYLERTGEVAGNDESCRYFVDHFEGPDADLVQSAFDWRSDPLPTQLEIVHLLRAGLSPLYRRFLEIYVPRLEEYEETELAAKLTDWRERLA